MSGIVRDFTEAELLYTEMRRWSKNAAYEVLIDIVWVL